MLLACHARHGKVTADIIAADPLLPDPQLFVRAFGSLIKAYDQAGLVRTRTHNFLDTKDACSAHRDRLCNLAAALAKQAGASAQTGDLPGRLIINGTLAVQIVVPPGFQPKRGQERWTVRQWPGVDFHIAARAESIYDRHDYFLLSAEAFPLSGKIYLKGADGGAHAEFRHVDLMSIFAIRTEM